MAEPGRYSVPEVARLLGISERAVRKRIAVGTLQAEREGPHWAVTLAEPVAGTAAVPGGTDGGTGGTTPAEVQRAIEATGARYVADFAALYDRISIEVGRLYEGQLAAKDETIAELRRRAETAEAALASRVDIPPERVKVSTQSDAAKAYPAREEGLRARLGRWWRGEG